MAKSMGYNAAAGLSGMLKDGHKTFEGVQGAVIRNIEAAKAISGESSVTGIACKKHCNLIYLGMVRTSLGPNGMNKLVVNHLEKIIVTSDCASIMKELEVQHPAAKILVLASEMQETEHGDNTNFVISFGGELLHLAEDLLRQGLHTAEIVEGYQRAYKKVLELLPTLVVKTVHNVRDEQEVTNVIRSIIATKQYGYEDLIARLVVDACLTTVSPTAKTVSINMDSVRIAKLPGGSLTQSTVVKGMVILRESEGIIKRAVDAKVVVFGCGFEATSSEAKGKFTHLPTTYSLATSTNNQAKLA